MNINIRHSILIFQTIFFFNILSPNQQFVNKDKCNNFLKTYNYKNKEQILYNRKYLNYT